MENNIKNTYIFAKEVPEVYNNINHLDFNGEE